VSDDTNTRNDEEHQDDLDVTDENADDVKGGSFHGNVKKQPEGFRGAPKKGPDGIYHGG
jgi:hypothetical protein